jgi:predicted MPP superfamily phosphohydrolase
MPLARRSLQPIFAAAGIAGVWGLFEAQWVEFSRIEVPLERLPAELDGFSILHLSDLHLGTVSLNGRALDRAVSWVEGEDADLVVLTGDLLSRGRAEAGLRKALARLRAGHGVFAVLGNHDVEAARSAIGSGLLEDSSIMLDVEGRRVQVVGGAPREDWKHARLERLADPSADLRILLFHFPDVAQWLPAGSYDLILAGHLHGGQICLPLPGGRKLRLEHLRAPYWEGLHRTPAGMLHVSRGLGTSFVPFRLLARPEATKLVLRCPTGSTP